MNEDEAREALLRNAASGIMGVADQFRKHYRGIYTERIRMDAKAYNHLVASVEELRLVVMRFQPEGEAPKLRLPDRE